MTETAQIIEAITNMHDAINTSFRNVYKKIDEKFDQCDERLSSVEQDLAVKEGIKKEKQKTKDWWLIVIRSVTIAGAVSLTTIAIYLIVSAAIKLGMFGLGLK